MTLPDGREVISYYEIELSTYHNEIVARIQFPSRTQGIQQSCLMPLRDIGEVLQLWRSGDLLGSFGIGTILDADARFIMFQRG